MLIQRLLVGNIRFMTKEFGERLSYYRHVANFTQVELGKKLGIVGPQVAHYERGTRNMKIQRAVSSLDSLGIPAKEQLVFLLSAVGLSEEKIEEVLSASGEVHRIIVPQVKINPTEIRLELSVTPNGTIQIQKL